MKKIFFYLFIFLFVSYLGIINVFAEDGTSLYCEYGFPDKTGVVNEAIYTFYIDFYGQDSDTYDYEFKDVYGNDVYSSVAPNTKDDLIRLGMYNEEHGVIGCPSLAVSADKGLISRRDASSDDKYLSIVLSDCSFNGCKFENLPILNPNDGAYTCNYKNENNESLTIEGKNNTCTVTYPDGTQKDEINGICGAATSSCMDLFFDSSTKQVRSGTYDFSSWFDGNHNNYDPNLYNFICSNGVSYYCVGNCKYPNNRNINCEAIAQKIEPGKITCRSVFYDENGNPNKLYDALQNIFKLMEFAAPVLLIALSTMDYIKAIASHDADDLKKANERFAKRLVIAILIFLLPFLLDFVFETFGVYNIETCGVGK